jgi:hypothetical protein
MEIPSRGGLPILLKKIGSRVQFSRFLKIPGLTYMPLTKIKNASWLLRLAPFVAVAIFMLLAVSQVVAQTTLSAGAGVSWDNTGTLSTDSGITLQLGLAVEYLIVGGGGGGGNGWHGGGGGAGGMLQGSTVIGLANQTIVVGAGGAGGTSTQSSTAGAGGAGKASSITGTSVKHDCRHLVAGR